MTAQYQKSLEAGYSPEEIINFLSNHPKYSDKIHQSRESGYSDEEIGNFLSQRKEEKPKKEKKSFGEKALRTAAQLGIGAAESALLPYEIATVPLASKEAQTAAYREGLGEDIENLLLQKSTGVWSPEDEKFLQSLQKQMDEPEEAQKFVQTGDVGVRGLLEKATGTDLHPEGVIEKGAQWAGFLKNPSKILEAGINPKNLFKAIAPTGTEVLRGLGAGTALEMAEQGQFGPLGTMGIAILGDLVGAGAGQVGKGIAKFATAPKKTIAEVAAKFTPKDKMQIQKDLIKDFEKAGLQADLGTITDSNLIKNVQARLSQSSLVGKSVDEFKNELTNQIKREYGELANALGEAKYSTFHEAGEVAKEGIKKIRDADALVHTNLYKAAEKALKEGASVNSSKLSEAISALEKKLVPGKLKSGEQKIVLDALETLKKDVHDAGSNLKFSDVRNLMNDKIGMEDIINYEAQGGAKKLLKNIVYEIDRSIISHGKENPSFAKNYVMANKKFSQHAKEFRNKDLTKLLMEQDPEKLMNRMNSIHGIRQVGNILGKTTEGKEIFNNLKRMKLEKTVGDHLVDNATEQVKLGTFSNILEKGKSKEIIKEILGPENFRRLERLQKNAGKLADSANKFFNSSKSGVVAADSAVMTKALFDLSALLMGSPWPLIKTAGLLISSRKFAQLITDPEFLKLVEDVIKNADVSPKKLVLSIEALRPYILEGLNQAREQPSRAR